MSAYNECYVYDASSILGEFFDYMTKDMHYKMDEAFELLASSNIGTSFGHGNPKYVAGVSGPELAWKLLYEVFGTWEEPVESTITLNRSLEYWVGWVLAQYQWTKNVSFRYLINHGLTASKVASRYILHEADISKFFEFADSVIEEAKTDEEPALKRLRKYYELTQKQLSEKSGVSLRMIQLYEQKQADISKAQVNIVTALAEALSCKVEDLVG